MGKHVIPCIILFSFLIPTITSFATSWAYPFVVWDGSIYVVSDEYITQIHKEIGEVTMYSDMEQYSGNFSNVYEKGTKYYSIEGISTDKAIAIQENNGKFKKAIREAAYPYEEISAAPTIGLMILSLIILTSIYFVKNRINK
ncbi:MULTISPECIES: hypothetical protein [Virgibacillus]|uniref:Uncharacterized protein n=1 Tax=Virgibacillus massiliensis TaxID=1462526 RepID=A0A024QEA0_9BACI|nr:MULTISPECIES: hypothetical protein [Virgibacillus]EQB34904.1 hypothetical protein M948_17500 [Virgibacillus sp. CM-4]CDQ40878.1 hypothetical protein BN990_03211 [Virgibacillus massiliensis]